MEVYIAPNTAEVVEAMVWSERVGKVAGTWTWISHPTCCVDGTMDVGGSHAKTDGSGNTDGGGGQCRNCLHQVSDSLCKFTHISHPLPSIHY